MDTVHLKGSVFLKPFNMSIESTTLMKAKIFIPCLTLTLTGVAV
jgi:hypothetical protein